jgi:serine/threonine protein phosphatase PrpC
MDTTVISEVYDSIIGTHRNENQDGILVLNTEVYSLFFVFDGLGSSSNSAKAVQIAKSFIFRNHANYYSNENFSLASMMSDVHLSLIESKLEKPYAAYAGLYIDKSMPFQMKYSNLGDVRLYGVSKNYLHQLSEDDSVSRNVLSKCLGMERLNRQHFSENQVQLKDSRFLLCSDGFYTIMNQRLKKFHYFLNLKQFTSLKKGLASLVSNKNGDDSTYVLIESKNV